MSYLTVFWGGGLQMKAVAGLKMSYQVQQAINGSKHAVIRGFRHDDSDSALCSHLYTMVRGNRQHRRAFLISLLNLFDDSSVSSSLYFGTIGLCQEIFRLLYLPSEEQLHLFVI